MNRWMLFCEAEADQRTAARLIDELLRLHVEWARDLELESVREWQQDDAMQRAWFDLHTISEQADRLGVFKPYGHFDGSPAAPGARLLETVSRIVRRISQRDRGPSRIEAVVVMWDMDGQGDARRAGLRQASAQLPPDPRFVLACPDPMREAWVLAGFQPLDEAEEARLEEARQRLGFWPNDQPDRLRPGKSPTADPKRLLDQLGVTREREELCLAIADPDRRSLLGSRGQKCGLETFLRGVEERLVPLVTRSPPDS